MHGFPRRRPFARRAPTTVLMYHRVGPEARDLHRLRVRDDRFADHLATIERHADIVPLADVLTPARRPRVAITFDDGYADNLHVAEPILAAHHAPATVFVAAGVIEAGTGFWQDRLQVMMLDSDHDVRALDVDIAGEHVHAPFGSPEEREQAYRAVHARIRRRPPEEIEAVLDAVAGQLGHTTGTNGDAVTPTLTVEEVGALARSPVVEVGSHTLRHPFLTALDAATQRREIVDSRARLASWTGAPVTTFAYPFGVKESFDSTSERCARDAGYDLSVTGVPGRVTRFTAPHRVPRRYVGDWDSATFEQRLRDWIGA
jgi:peptidoglycan/xylan/chitin deacetylase (PgdA/CDA1 family)